MGGHRGKKAKKASKSARPKRFVAVRQPDVDLVKATEALKHESKQREVSKEANQRGPERPPSPQAAKASDPDGIVSSPQGNQATITLGREADTPQGEGPKISTTQGLASPGATTRAVPAQSKTRETPQTTISKVLRPEPGTQMGVDMSSPKGDIATSGWALIPYCSPADFLGSFKETSLAVQKPAGSQARTAAATQKGTPSKLASRSGIPLNVKMMICYRSLLDMTPPCLSTSGQSWAITAYNPASALHNFRKSLMSTNRPLRPTVDVHPTEIAIFAVAAEHGNIGTAGGDASQGRDSNTMVTAKEDSLPDDEVHAAFLRLQPPSQAPLPTGVNTEIGVVGDFDFSNPSVDFYTAIAISTVSDLLSPVATAIAIAATITTTIVKPSPKRTLIGKVWDKATKLAVLPVVFFRRQSWKPAPELVAATDPVPETFPKSPDSAAEAASKTASQPSLDLTKTVVSYNMLDIHCCSRTTSSCKGRPRLGSA